MLAAARKHKRVVQVGTQRRSTPHLIEARDRIVREGKLGKIGLVEIYCYYHMRATRQPARHQPARDPRLRDVDRPGADAAVQPDRPPAGLAGVHGVRQRHRGRHVHPHARHGPLDARPGLAAGGSPRRAASWSTRRARRTSPTPRRPRSTSATSTSSGSTAPGATPVDPKYPWGATFYGDKGTLKVSVNSYDFTPIGRRQADPRRRRDASSTSTPRTGPRRTWRSTSPRRSAATCRTSSPRSPRAASPWPTSRRGTSRPRAASWPTSP